MIEQLIAYKYATFKIVINNNLHSRVISLDAVTSCMPWESQWRFFLFLKENGRLMVTQALKVALNPNFLNLTINREQFWL